MRAAVFTSYGESLEIKEVDAPTAKEESIVVETEACGICRSDWHAWRGDPLWKGRRFEEGHIFGHEPAGIVVEVGDEVEQIREGERVAVPFNLGDGKCMSCRNGHSNVCDNGIPLGLTPESNGAFAERFRVPWADYNTVPLADDVSPIEMAGLGCRFMTSFHALSHRADVYPGDWVAIHGCGGIGLSAVHIADALGANVIAIDLFKEKLELASDLGAVITLNANETIDVTETVKNITDGGADVSIDALGIAETCRNSVKCLRKLGQHIQIGLTSTHDGSEISLPTDLIATQELKIIGTYGMQPHRFNEIFQMIQHGKINPGSLVTDKISIEETPEILESMTEYQTSGIPVITEF